MTKLSELPAEAGDSLSGLDYVKTFSKRMLKTQIFIGTYQEKRFVQPLNSYRDVVKVDSDEKHFIENLLTVKRKVQHELADSLLWIGITEPNVIGAPAGYCLWVTLPVNIFGTYWFKVKSVEFLPAEVRVKLEVVRGINASADKPKFTTPQATCSNESNVDLKNISQQVGESLNQFFKETITLSNIKHTVVFLALLVSTMIVGAINLVKFLLEYMLQLIRELSGLVKALTPIILTCLDLLRRTVYGAFSFILALFFGRQVRPATQQYNCYENRLRSLMIEYPEINNRMRYRQWPRKSYRSSVTIEPVED